MKTSLIRQFERDFLDRSENEERAAVYGPFGFNTPGPLPDNMYTHINDAKMKKVVAAKWADYEQYYDPVKVAEFQAKFKSILDAYNASVVTPREDMYLSCMKSQFFQGYFQHNFDTEELSSGIDYVQTLNYCVAGMQDKLGAAQYFKMQLSGKPSDVTNMMARALSLNQSKLAAKLEEGVQGSVDMLSLPWSSVADAVNTTITRMKDQSAGVMGIFFALMAGPLTSGLQETLESPTMFYVLLSMGAFSNKAIVTYDKTGSYKQFVGEVVGRLAKDSGLSGKVNADRLRTYVSKELRRLRIDGLPMEGSEMKKFLVMIDLDKVEELKALPPKARSAALSKLLRTVGDVEAEQFSNWQSAVQRGMNKAGQGMPFTLGVVSGILQTVAIWRTVDFKGKTLTADQNEAYVRFGIGVAAALSTGLGIVETGIKQFKLFSNPASRLSVLRSGKFLTWIGKVGPRLGAIAGVFTAFVDFYHSYDESQKGHTGLAWAFGFSAASGLWLAVSLLYALPVIGTVIATLILIGMAIVLAVFSQDNIQKWLEQCLWRRIPINKNEDLESQRKHLEYEARGRPIWPSREMNELKLALGEG